MKKVIFICLLSLSICLSEAAAPLPPTDKPVNGTSTHVTPIVPTPNEKKTENDSKNVIPDPQQTKIDNKPNTTVTEGTTPAPAPPTAGVTEKSNLPKNGTSEGDKNSSAKNDTKQQNGTDNINTTEGGAKPNGTTVVPPKADKVVTPEPPHVTEKPAVVLARGFDGPSFIGGIILTLGLLAIGFMGFKYYKNQTERNYHTL